jgi:hypothetical protein
VQQIALTTRLVGGRRKYNAARQRIAQTRRAEIVAQFGEGIILPCRGLRSSLAAYFDVSLATICRDIQAVKKEYRRNYICPNCGNWFDVPIKAQAAQFQRERRRNPEAKPSCCVSHYLATEAVTTRTQKRRRLL